MADATDDVALAAAEAKRRRRNGILTRRAVFFVAAAWYFVFRVSQPVHLECARVENARVNCFMLRKWAGIIPDDRRNYSDVRRARVDDRQYWFGDIRYARYMFNLDTGALMRSGPPVQWMDRQNGAELERVASDLTAWIGRPSSANYIHNFRIAFLNGMLVLLVSIGALALLERWIKRGNATRPIELA